MNFGKVRFLTFITLCTIFSASIYAALPQQSLPLEHQREILRTHLASPKLQTTLNPFLTDATTQQFFNLERRFICPWGNNRLTSKSLSDKALYMQNFTQIIDTRINLLYEMACRYNLTCFKGFDKNDTNTIICSPEWGNCIIKIPNKNYPKYPEIYAAYTLSNGKVNESQDFNEIIATTTLYQNVSRVFMSKEVTEKITQMGFNKIIVPHKVLCPLPWAQINKALGYPEVNDSNYVVVAEFIPDLMTQEDNKAAFVNMKKHPNIKIDISDFESPSLLATKIKPEYYELLTQLIHIIKASGLWNITEATVFVVNYNNDTKIVLLDLQKPGLGGSEDGSFFHLNPAEVACNAKAGIVELASLLN